MTKSTANTSHTTSTKAKEAHINLPNEEFEDDEPPYQQKVSRVSTKSAPSDPSTYYLELAVYVLSGVLLIFILEQFVQLGLHMR